MNSLFLKSNENTRDHMITPSLCSDLLTQEYKLQVDDIGQFQIQAVEVAFPFKKIFFR